MCVRLLRSAKRGSSSTCLILSARSLIRPIVLAAPVLTAALARPLEAQEASPPPGALQLPEVTVSATTTPEPLTDGCRSCWFSTQASGRSCNREMHKALTGWESMENRR
jgi:hypothetical protein